MRRSTVTIRIGTYASEAINSMSVRRISIIVVALILLGIAGWYFFIPRSGTPSASQPLTNILPFGSGEGSGSSPSSTVGTSAGTSPLPGTPTSHLFKISDTPIAGAVAFLKGGALTVRYIERATGHIYDIDPLTMAKQEIVNETVPKVYEAVWKQDGSAVVLRTLRSDGETIDSISYQLIPPSGTSTADFYTTKSAGLPANVSEIAAGKNNIFYTLKGLPQVVRALFDGSKAATLINTAFNQWNLRAGGDASLFLTTKAAAGADGYAYILNATTGALQKVLGPLSSLLALPNSDISRVLYAYTNGSRSILEARKLSTGSIYELHPFTFPEKCTWSIKHQDRIYCGVPADQPLPIEEPTPWIQGNTHYTDRIWKFDTDSDFSSIIAEPKKEFGINMDAEHLFLSPNEDYLFFQNKNDLSLWALKLE